MKEAKFESIASQQGECRIAAMCRALGVMRQGYYQWASRPTSKHDQRDFELAKLIGDEYEASMGIYGALKVFMRLRKSGISTSRKRVARIMAEYSWRSVASSCAKRPSGEKRAPRSESHDGLVKCNFSADGPNKAWFADITYVRTHQGVALPSDRHGRLVEDGGRLVHGAANHRGTGRRCAQYGHREKKA